MLCPRPTSTSERSAMSHRLPSARVSLFLEVDRHVCARFKPYLVRVTDKHSMRCEMSRISRPRPISARYTPTHGADKRLMHFVIFSPVTGTKKMEYKSRQWHEKCFCCCVCKTPIGTKSFIPRDADIYCAGCYEEKFATRCVKCDKVLYFSALHL